MTQEERKIKAAEIFVALQDLLLQLAGRWMDEHAYENINDYATPINAALAPYGCSVETMYKRPFGFSFILADATYRVAVTARSYSYACTKKAHNDR